MAEAEGVAARTGAHIVADAVKPFAREAEAVGENAATDAARTAERAAARDGPKPGWTSRIADNGKGTVYQRPGATRDADSFRDMDPTDRYPDGYVRFYNGDNQPIGLDGKPGPRSHTHIPRRPDGSYPIPDGW